MLDANSLYGYQLMSLLPYGDFQTLSGSELEYVKNNFRNIPLSGVYSYALMVSYVIPDHIQKQADKLPLTIAKNVVKREHLSKYSQELHIRSGVESNE